MSYNWTELINKINAGFPTIFHGTPNPQKDSDKTSYQDLKMTDDLLGDHKKHYFPFRISLKPVDGGKYGINIKIDFNTDLGSSGKEYQVYACHQLKEKFDIDNMVMNDPQSFQLEGTISNLENECSSYHNNSTADDEIFHKLEALIPSVQQYCHEIETAGGFSKKLDNDELLNLFKKFLDDTKGYQAVKSAGSVKSRMGTIARNLNAFNITGMRSLSDLSTEMCDQLQKLIDDRHIVVKKDDGIGEVTDKTYTALKGTIKAFKTFILNRPQFFINEKFTAGRVSMGKKENKLINSIETCFNNGNKQIVLTGAPGTGKSFTVREYVKNETKNDESTFRFVQFHPSYDYSDFVEGLRPVPDDSGTENLFVRLDGTFKEFCRQIVEENYGLKGITDEKTYADKLEEEYNKASGKTEKNDEFIQDEEEPGNEPDEENDSVTEPENNEKKYFFIIDEINRADLSKVFGELMFCLDESYRGIQNRIQTQYKNLPTYHKDETTGKFEILKNDCFRNGFFIPENLYIIGTMNDIDRSVESFDFALRRRFQWIEADANNSIDDKLGEMLGDDTGCYAVYIQNAKNVNDLFTNEEGKKLGLSKQYQLGRSYFKGFDGTIKSVDKILENKINPIIREYCRGRDEKKVNDFIEHIANVLKEGIENISSASGTSATSDAVSDGSSTVTAGTETPATETTVAETVPETSAGENTETATGEE